MHQFYHKAATATSGDSLLIPHSLHHSSCHFSCPVRRRHTAHQGGRCPIIVLSIYPNCFQEIVKIVYSAKC